MNKATPNDFVFYIERTFDAPLARVWKAWTDEAQLAKWFGPKDCPVFYGKLDLREGGTYHYGMKAPDGSQMWGHWTFKSIEPPHRLVFIVSFSDAAGDVPVPHPGYENWPLEILSTVIFHEENGRTKVAIEWVAHNASDIERRTFEEGQDDMVRGWTGTFDKLEVYLAAD